MFQIPNDSAIRNFLQQNSISVGTDERANLVVALPVAVASSSTGASPDERSGDSSRDSLQQIQPIISTTTNITTITTIREDELAILKAQLKSRDKMIETLRKELTKEKHTTWMERSTIPAPPPIENAHLYEPHQPYFTTIQRCEEALLSLRQGSEMILGWKRNLEEMEAKKIEDSKLCIICWEVPKQVALIPCGHKCVCEMHGQRLLSGREKCPICRAQVSNILKVYE